MKRISIFLSLLMSATLHAQTSQSFQDNADVSIVLSDSNYNRLVVRGDKIINAHFPEQALGIKNEDDGSLYVMVAQKEPFTLFLTTEAGHHLSATVNTESSLGKTIEFVPQTVSIAKKAIPTPTNTPKPVEAEGIEALMSHLVQQDAILGFDMKHHYGRAIRLHEGLTLFPRLTYTSKTLTGEVTEIYNGGKTPIDLTEHLFMGQGVKAVSLSKPTLLPKQKAYVYRVLESHHG
jgi:conjugal transfer pilus assembly protein TraK